MIPLWFLPYALACGNTFVLKPSEQDPLASERIVELIDGDRRDPGRASSTSSTAPATRSTACSTIPRSTRSRSSARRATARYVSARAADNGKRVQALGGAKNAMVVMPDADPELMTKGVTASAFGAAGPALPRRLARGARRHAARAGPLARPDRRRRRSALRTGDGADPATDVCPLVNPAARERVEGEIEQALADGVELVLDGRRDGGAGGRRARPDDPRRRRPRTAASVTEELFGPVLTLMRAPDLDAAIEQVNASRYGNASVIFTSSGGAAREYRYGVEAGMVGVEHRRRGARSRGSRSPAGRTRSTATCTPTAWTRSTSTRARRW